MVGVGVMVKCEVVVGVDGGVVRGGAFAESMMM